MIENLALKLDQLIARHTASYAERTLLVAKHGNTNYRSWLDEADKLRFEILSSESNEDVRTRGDLEREIYETLGDRFYRLSDGRHVSCCIDSSYGICVQILKEYTGKAVHE